jgi:hypothetical protein
MRGHVHEGSSARRLSHPKAMSTQAPMAQRSGAQHLQQLGVGYTGTRVTQKGNILEIERGAGMMATGDVRRERPAR